MDVVWAVPDWMSMVNGTVDSMLVDSMGDWICGPRGSEMRYWSIGPAMFGTGSMMKTGSLWTQAS